MPIPGARELYGAWPKVHLSLKMQKSAILNLWWMKTEETKDVVFVLNRLYSEVRTGVEREKILNLFRIFTGKKYTAVEITIGLNDARLLGARIQNTRNTYKTTTNWDLAEEQKKFYNEKFDPKLREIYEKREIPLFNAKTHGELVFLNRIINEKELGSQPEFNDDRKIWVFKFKDANGILSLNFYSQKPYRRSRRGRW